MDTNPLEPRKPEPAVHFDPEPSAQQIIGLFGLCTKLIIDHCSNYYPNSTSTKPLFAIPMSLLGSLIKRNNSHREENRRVIEHYGGLKQFLTKSNELVAIHQGAAGARGKRGVNWEVELLRANTNDCQRRAGALAQFSAAYGPKSQEWIVVLNNTAGKSPHHSPAANSGQAAALSPATAAGRSAVPTTRQVNSPNHPNNTRPAPGAAQQSSPSTKPPPPAAARTTPAQPPSAQSPVQKPPAAVSRPQQSLNSTVTRVKGTSQITMDQLESMMHASNLDSLPAKPRRNARGNRNRQPALSAVVRGPGLAALSSPKRALEEDPGQVVPRASPSTQPAMSASPEGWDKTMARLSEEMETLFKSLIPKPARLADRGLLVQKLQNIIDTKWPGKRLRMEMFGSSVNMLDFDNSDVDLCISIPDSIASIGPPIATIVTSRSLNPTDAEAAEVSDVTNLPPKRPPPPPREPGYYNMNILAKLLRSAGMVSVFPIQRALVPICKFTDPQFGFTCDLNTNNVLGIENSLLVRAYCNVDPRVRPFLYSIKHWAKRRCINDPSGDRTPSSYTYVLTALWFLQQRTPPILPNLQKLAQIEIGEGRRERKVLWHRIKDRWIECDVSFVSEVRVVNGAAAEAKTEAGMADGPPVWTQYNTESVGALFYAFFDHFANHFDFANQVVSLRTGIALLKRDKGWEAGAFCVEDPFIIERNVVAGCPFDRIACVREEIARAEQTLKDRGGMTQCCYPWKEVKVAVVSREKKNGNRKNEVVTIETVAVKQIQIQKKVVERTSPYETVENVKSAGGGSPHGARVRKDRQKQQQQQNRPENRTSEGSSSRPKAAMRPGPQSQLPSRTISPPHEPLDSYSPGNQMASDVADTLSCQDDESDDGLKLCVHDRQLCHECKVDYRERNAKVLRSGESESGSGESGRESESESESESGSESESESESGSGSESESENENESESESENGSKNESDQEEEDDNDEEGDRSVKIMVGTDSREDTVGRR